MMLPRRWPRRRRSRRPWYVDARIAELERQTVFSKTWQVMGRVDQVEKPGQFVTATVAGEPLVAVRGTDGVLRAFYNVCRHHAAAVVTEPCGQASILHCPYHGWNYGLDGALKGMPEFDGVKNFERKDNGLVPVKVDTWEQFVFVNLDPNAAPLAEFLRRNRQTRRAAWIEQNCITSAARLMTFIVTGRYSSIITSMADTMCPICIKVSIRFWITSITRLKTKTGIVCSRAPW